MNFFSIKELQSVLRNRFFNEIVSDNIIKINSFETNSGSRYKINNFFKSNNNIQNNFGLKKYNNNINQYLNNNLFFKKKYFNFESNFYNYFEKNINKRFISGDSPKYSYKYKTGGYMYKMPNFKNFYNIDNSLFNSTVQMSSKLPFWFYNFKIKNSLSELNIFFNVFKNNNIEKTYFKNYFSNPKIIKKDDRFKFENLSSFEIKNLSTYYYFENVKFDYRDDTFVNKIASNKNDLKYVNT